jgi:hypothetical protein
MSKVSPDQLRMFMPAAELRAMDSIDVMQTPESRFGGAWKSKEAMWKTKHRENKMDGFDAEIASEGVQHPVTLAHGSAFVGGRPVIQDGHHRIAAQAKDNPSAEVPVEHYDHDDHNYYGRRP